MSVFMVISFGVPPRSVPCQEKSRKNCSQMMIHDNMCSRFILITWRECRKIIKKNIKMYGTIYKEKTILAYDKS